MIQTFETRSGIKGDQDNTHRMKPYLRSSHWIKPDPVTKKYTVAYTAPQLAAVPEDSLAWFDEEPTTMPGIDYYFQRNDLIREMRAAFPDAKFSFYGAPIYWLLTPNNINERQYDHGMHPMLIAALEAHTESDGNNRGKNTYGYWYLDSFLPQRAIADKLDYYATPFYIRKNTREEFEQTKTAIDLFLQLMREHYPDKPLYAYISPHEKDDHTVMLDFFEEYLEFLSTRVKGVIVWTAYNFAYSANENGAWMQALEKYSDLT